MTDWRQIQARIRKAKTSTNPSAKLSELYLRTRDAMVAWELGAFEEKNGRTDEATKWYITAAQRFRRAEWKKKAEEALTRLGVEVPAVLATPFAGGSPEAAAKQAADELTKESLPSAHDELRHEPQMPLAVGEIPEPEAAEATPEPQPQGNLSGPGVVRRKRRRGRRGGRGRHGKPAAGSPALPPRAFAPSASTEASAHKTPVPASRIQVNDTTAYPVPPRVEEEQREEQFGEGRGAERAVAPRAAPPVPSERSARGRAGDPALASRMAHLESLLRRLLSSPLHRLDELDEAPAGPGVFLLSDSDQVTSYYVESCQTLRIGLGNLARSGRGGKSHRVGGRSYSEVDLKETFADHLGINQSKVSQYMKDHCVVRWIQLDDDASHLAHFAIGVLRTPLNLD
jgi:hypothetical protein